MTNHFFKNMGPFNIEELLKSIDIISLNNLKNKKISDIKELNTATAYDITFFHSKKYESLASKTNASSCITTKKLAHILPKTCFSVIVENVLLTTAKITNIFYPDAVTDNFDTNVSNINETSLLNKNSHKSVQTTNINILTSRNHYDFLMFFCPVDQKQIT